ncbi:MAG: efflux RND transporter periplasmic adaptor subunit [Phycisphaera sp.]|nr:MAG: efflux RND transporter periplasmic adaptor subunit [Phycisphaera sp.]
MRNRAILLAAAASSLAFLTLGGLTIPQPGAYTGVSRPSQVRELAFAVRGKIADVNVEPGDQVKVGDHIMKLDDAVQRASLALAQAQQADDTRLQLARISLDFAERELELVEQSSAEGGANQQDLREARFSVDRAKVEVRAAELEAEQRRITVEREQARLDEMSMHSTIDGDVINISRREGETVDEQTPVVTIVQVNPVRIDVSVPVPVSRTLEVGQSASVVWLDVETDAPADGKIIFISTAGEASVREVLIRIEVPNPELLPSGMHARVSF